MAVTWITPVDVTPSTTLAWIDVDVSAHVSASATGAILHIVNTTAGSKPCRLRKNGSTDDIAATLAPTTHLWAKIGVDGSGIFEAYIGSGPSPTIYIVGYHETDAVFFTNVIDKSLTTTAAWTDIDISSDTSTDTAIGAIFQIYNGSTPYLSGIRKNGSTDARTADQYETIFTEIGVDGSEICEAYIENVTVDHYLVGYTKTDTTYNTNATDLSLGSTGSYIDLSALPSGATGGIIETGHTLWRSYALRKNGSAEDIYYDRRMSAWAFVECDASQLIEGKIEDTAVDFFLTGYTTAGAGGANYLISKLGLMGVGI